MASPDVRRGTARWRRLLLAGSVVLSLVLLLTPGALVPPSPQDTDKAVHGLLFTLLAVAALLAGHRVRTVLLVLLAYAVASEVLQAVLPIRRSGDVRDAVTDGVGVLLGLLLAPLVERVLAHLVRRRTAAGRSGGRGTAGPTPR